MFVVEEKKKKKVKYFLIRFGFTTRESHDQAHFFVTLYDLILNNRILATAQWKNFKRD